MPVTRLSVGLFRNGAGGRSDLVGVCVFAHPVNNASVPNSAGLSDPRSACDLGRLVLRSEEHTSELPPLPRISYAVFCLKKKTNQHTTSHLATSRTQKKTIKH